ncbi:4-hydroxythreonine-4-phosphate dehydrogenase PdxA [Halocola ammonii]
MSKKDKSKIRVGITVGEINGIGLEVIMKTFQDNRMMEDIVPIVYGNSEVAKVHRKALGIEDFSFHGVKEADEARSKKANMINVWEEEVKVDLGKPSKETGIFSFKSLDAAVTDLAANKIDVLITAPIDKDNIQSKDFEFPGHTEFLAKMSNVEESLMFLVAEDLRVGVATGHIPLKDVASVLDKDGIVKKLRLMNESLIKDFGVPSPKIAVLGLNPHAGDNGLLGTEEKEIITPAIREVKEEGIYAFGPYGADGFFGTASYKKFDGVLAMYHDQGLIPFKTIAFEDGVNFTAGLPIVRTSPDHGTAYEIAGKNLASEGSMRQAIFVACDIYRNRQTYKEISANPLEPQEKPRSKSRS